MMKPEVSSDVSTLVEHLFRHTYGKLTAQLTSIFGVRMLSSIEDIVSETLLSAMHNWSYHGIPDNPEAWLFRSCRNKAIDFIRKEKTAKNYADRIAEFDKRIENQFEASLSHEVTDDILKMMLYCCHPALSSQSQIALTLKTVAGFSIKEIASAYFEPEANIAQRITRAKRTLKEQNEQFDELTPEIIQNRFLTLIQVLYMMFNEGYYSQSSDKIIRTDLILESIRLVELLIPIANKQKSELYGLIALFYFHASRLPARISNTAEMILLKDQDRSLWDKELINKGFSFFNQSIGGDSLSEYHLYASIAASHCSAEAYEKTDWDSILKSYDMLIEMKSSSLLKLNRAVVIKELQGASRALEEIEDISEDPFIDTYYLFHAVKASLLVSNGNNSEAIEAYQKAIDLTSSEVEKKFLEKQIEKIR